VYKTDSSLKGSEKAEYEKNYVRKYSNLKDVYAEFWTVSKFVVEE
jgi:hypothetical protein